MDGPASSRRDLFDPPKMEVTFSLPEIICRGHFFKPQNGGHTEEPGIYIDADMMCFQNYGYPQIIHFLIGFSIKKNNHFGVPLMIRIFSLAHPPFFSDRSSRPSHLRYDLFLAPEGPK